MSQPIVTPSINLVKARPRTLKEAVRLKLRQIVEDNWTLGEAFLVAVSLHVVFFPIMWIAGWALPWPKAPVFTTIVEYDLRGWTGWPKLPKAKKIFDIMDPDLNK